MRFQEADMGREKFHVRDQDVERQKGENILVMMANSDWSSLPRVGFMQERNKMKP